VVEPGSKGEWPQSFISDKELYTNSDALGKRWNCYGSVGQVVNLSYAPSCCYEAEGWLVGGRGVNP
jgi:hypothetical protein